MKYFLSLITIIFTINSCSEGPSKSDYDKLKAEFEDCKKQNEDNQRIISELKITPEQRLKDAKRLFDENNLTEAKKILDIIIDRYPDSDFSKKANNFKVQITSILEKQIAEAERLKALGFKALKEVNRAVIGDVTLNFNSISYSQKFIFDRYDNSYHYQSAERDNKFIVASVSISAESKDPNLPPVSVYKIDNGELIYLTTLDYEFARWDDYGSYLGNTSDFRNDFSHTKTIKFELGSQISADELNKHPIFIVVRKENIFYRNYERFANPPISYRRTSFDNKSFLKVENFKTDFILIKIFNKNLL